MPGFGQNDKLGSRDVLGRMYLALEQELGLSWASQIGMLFKSNQETEKHRWLGMSPQMREWLDGRQAKGLAHEGIDITNKTYEATLEVSIDDLRRDKTGQLQIRITDLARRAQAHWAKLLSTLIIDAASTDCYDGQYFFDADHSEGSSGTISNDITVTEVAALNVGTAAAPTADEMASCLIGVIGHMFSFKDDQGEPLNELARQFLVMVPTTLWASTLTACSKNNLYTGSGVRDNPIISNAFSIIPVANPRLNAWTTQFAVFEIGSEAKAFIRQEEVPLTVSAIAEGSEEEFKNRRHLYGVEAVRNVGYGFWQKACLATLS